MMSRCYNNNAPDYRYYGAKGTYVCDEWVNDKNVFFEWALNNGYKEGLHLDKDKLHTGNGPKHYGPDTCVWMSPEENCSRR